MRRLVRIGSLPCRDGTILCRRHAQRGLHAGGASTEAGGLTVPETTELLYELNQAALTCHWTRSPWRSARRHFSTLAKRPDMHVIRRKPSLTPMIADKGALPISIAREPHLNMTAIENVRLFRRTGGISRHHRPYRFRKIHSDAASQRPAEADLRAGLFEGKDIWKSTATIRQIRFQVGLVFQYPEYQLFEETVYKDIAFGPKNMGLYRRRDSRRVLRGLQACGPAESAAWTKSPFELSGGQKRRVAIAGVIAMEPDGSDFG